VRPAPARSRGFSRFCACGVGWPRPAEASTPVYAPCAGAESRLQPVLVNTLAIGVIERRREIGMLRAVGATRRQVRRVILVEALILAAIGVAFGLLAGLYLGYMAVVALSAFGFSMDYAFPGSAILLAIAAGLLFGVLAALIPARQAAGLPIVAALRHE